MFFRQIPCLQLADYLQDGEAFHFASTQRRAGERVPEHTHDFAEMFWVRGHACEHLINGRVQVVEPGMLVLMRPEDRHAFHNHDEGQYRIANLAFPREVLPALLRRFPELVAFYDPAQPMPHTLKLTTQQQAALQHAAQRLLHVTRAPIYLECFLLNLFTSLLPDAALDMPAEAPDWLRVTIEELARSGAFAEGPQALARLSRRSPDYVARELKRWMGMTPSELINRMRMRWAARQLETTERAISEIASGCGVENLSHFYKLFQRATGHPPAAWRKQRRSLT